MAFVYVPNGVNMEDGTPATTGTDFTLPKILEPLAPLRSSDGGDYKRSMRMLTLVLLLLAPPLSAADVARVVQSLMAEENALAGVPSR